MTSKLLLSFLLAMPFSLYAQEVWVPTLNDGVGDVREGVESFRKRWIVGNPERIQSSKYYAHNIGVNLNIRAGIGYSCGQFNMFNNLAQEIDNLKKQASKLPGELQNAATAAVAAAPGYLLHKSAPEVYALLNEKIDEAFQLFQLSYKSCKQIEREMLRGNANPYADFMQVSVGEQWSKNIGIGSITEIEQTVDENAAEDGFTFAKCQKVGGSDTDPAFIYEELITAGFNTLHNRSDISSNASTRSAHTFTQFWARPSSAVSWIHQTFGEEIVKLGQNTNVSPIVGVGLFGQFEVLSNTFSIAFEEVAGGEYENYNNLQKIYPSLKERPETLRELLTLDDRGNSHGKRLTTALMIVRLSKYYAYEVLFKRLTAMYQLINAGLRSRCIIHKPAETAATAQVNKLFTRARNEHDLLKSHVQSEHAQRILKELIEVQN